MSHVCSSAGMCSRLLISAFSLTATCSAAQLAAFQQAHHILSPVFAACSQGASFFWAEPPPQADAKKPKGKAAKKQAAADKAAARAADDTISAKTAQVAPTGTPPPSRISRGIAGLRHALGLRDRAAAQAALPGTADEAAGLSTTVVEGSADGGVKQASSVARSSTDTDSVAEAKAQAVQLQLQQQVGGGDWHTSPSTLHAMSTLFGLTHHHKHGCHSCNCVPADHA